MNGNDRFWVLLAALAVGLILGILWINHLNEQNFIQHGFIRGSIPGQSMTQWVKP